MSEEKQQPSSAGYTPVEVREGKTQIRVLYIRHGESVSNYFKNKTKKKDITSQDLLDLVVRENESMRKILPPEDIACIKELVPDKNVKKTIDDVEQKLRDVVLSKKGVHDAMEISKKYFGDDGTEDCFSIFSGKYPVTKIITSPLRRTQQTLMTVFGEKLTELADVEIDVEANPYFHEWVKRDTASSRCHKIQVSRNFPEKCAEHYSHSTLFQKEPSPPPSFDLWGWCCRRKRVPSKRLSGKWLDSLKRSLATELKPGWCEKGNEVAKEYAYFNSHETFTTFQTKQIEKIKTRLSQLQAEGHGAVLIVAHGMVARVLFKSFLGDHDMQNYGLIEAIWDNSKNTFVDCRFVQNDECSLPAWGKKKKRGF
mmetsp:Transcript_14991/g.20861  ORF Transcript_14991/g.20861 Transcript_14991/m.20861 type:complete len:368 (-) Transcript_14991:63-1166(-)|eukprot:CAMPEP_0185253404 /NCGR_PEP_ID=MMETSP1359-20130426/2170_1 /TAXON_ID=552665 /ORGANISM="Bigelowiella longifila, Strain CCMP242" /LENGTH=367 /DNA_ID=CAMNT_0027835777 /DNA_START=33 /DNA_END=1136 /DNA_ORIENTATION=-